MRTVFPLEVKDGKAPSLVDILDGMNELHSRLVSAENRPAAEAGEFTAGDRAVLTELAAFLGPHRIVADTLASKEAGAEKIDPNTGFAMVERSIPRISNQEQNGTGA